MSAQLKIEEAAFFLELLEALDQRKKPLTYSEDASKEASFLFSAILNAFYSAMAIMRDEESIDVTKLVKENPEIYARADKGGERAKTVHVSHTLPAHSGYIPQANFHMKQTPLLVQEAKKPGITNLSLGDNYYMYIDLHSKLVNVTEFCSEHYYELKEYYNANK